MSRYSSLSQLNFEPVANGLDLATVAVAYTTPAVLREKLFNLALVGNLQAEARFHLEHDSTAGTATVKLTDGVNDAISQEISLASSPATFQQSVDLSQYRGSSALYWQVEVTGAGSAGATGRMVANLTVQSPLFVSVKSC